MRPDGKPMTVPPRRLLAHEIVRFAGEPVAAVVATSRVAAQTAAEAIAIDYEILPVGGRIPSKPQTRRTGGVGRGARQYRRRHELWRRRQGWKRRLPVPRISFARSGQPAADSLRRWSRARPSPRSRRRTGRLILHVQSQTPGSTRDLLADAVLKRPKESIRVLVGDIGGGFGQKTSLYPEDGRRRLCRDQTSKEVRWRGDRTDEFVGGTHGRDLTSTGEFALDAKGRVLAYRVRSVGGTGAY
jgi:carbon-monoxide dehydrogenase large subunit